MKIKILYEDKDILAIDKPSGISVHADGKNKQKTVTDWVLKNYPKMENVGEPIIAKDLSSLSEGKSLATKNTLIIKRPGIVHRLDKETSGVLLLAKNQKAFEFLKNQFKDREVKKTYNAIVSGWVKDDRGVINKPIGRSPSDFRRRLAGRGARGEMREAVTEYKVLKRFEILAVGERWDLKNSKRSDLKETFHKFSYLELKPKTGRTHQIRVHMKFLNHPVVCDSLYDPKGFCPIGVDRLALHAESIEFKDLKGKTIKIESPLPKEFLKITKNQKDN